MDTQKPIVVVTGASGFIGQYVVKRLLEQNQVHVRCMTHNKQTQPNAGESDNLSYCYGDILKPKSLKNAFDGAWGVINLAGYRDFWCRNKKDYYRYNEDGAKHVFEAALACDIEHVIHVSTPMAYGMPKDSPFNEQSAIGPHANEYAKSKYQGDQIGWQLHQDKNLPLTILYLAAVVGAGDKKSTMEVDRALKGDMPALIGADVTYTYLYVKDAAEAIVRALFNQDTIGQRLLIGTQRATTREYFNKIGRLADVKIPQNNLPEKILMPVAKAMEAVSKVSGKRPLLPLDVLKTTAAGSLLFDGSLAEEMLEMEFAPLEVALGDAINELQPIDCN